MSWEWKDVLLPLSVILSPDWTVEQSIVLLKEEGFEVGFVVDNEEIIGYVTPSSLLNQLVNGDDKNGLIKPENNFLFVREDTQAKRIHNCFLVIGVDHSEKPTGYILMDDLQHQMNQLQLKSFNDALNSAEMGIVTMDASFHVQFMNEKAEQILGMKRSILQGRDYRKIIRMEESFDEVLEGQKWFGIENMFNFKVITGQFSPIYENGNIIGIIHNFYLKEQLKEAVHEVDFVQEMNEDLQAFYTLANEQILVVSASGTITRAAGAFFRHFWGEEDAGALKGKRIQEFVDKGIFIPDIVSAALEKQSRVSLTQEGKKGAVLSTAAPIYVGGKLKKVIVFSKDITSADKEMRTNEEPVHESASTVSIIYRSRQMHRLMDEVKAVAPLDSTVLIHGESGVGKEVIARKIHDLSSRSDNAFIAVNCGAIPENLIESVLFGHEKGAFTGADTRRIGLFEEAHNGTVFLDEISELPLLMQVKLLRVLEEREIAKVGSVIPVKVNVRVVAASNKNIKKMVEANLFREDLFYRLHVVPVSIPPLRKRKEDIAPLAIHFLEELNEQFGKRKKISTDALNALESYQWPGNIRELRNMIERLVVVSKEELITETDVYRVLWANDADEQSFLTVKGIVPLKKAVDEVERQLIEQAVAKFGTATEAAKALDISISTVSRRMKRFNGAGGAEVDLFFRN